MIAPLTCRLEPNRAEEREPEIAKCEGLALDADECALGGAGFSLRVDCLDHIVPPYYAKKRYSMLSRANSPLL
jgi:hypothetical protein